jgi:hypothetical protein
VVFTIGMVVYLLFAKNLYGAQPSPPAPRAGYWIGSGVHFSISLEGKKEDFWLRPEGAMISVPCQSLQEFHSVLENGQFFVTEGANKVDGLFATDGKFHGIFSISTCGQWGVSPAEEGAWEAEWISENTPNP